MQPGVASRLVAAPTQSRGDLNAAAGADRNLRAHGVAIRFGTLQQQREEVCAVGWRPVMEVSHRLVLRNHDGVDAPVVVKIADGESSTHPEHLKRRAGPRRDILQLATFDRRRIAEPASSRGTEAGHRGRVRWR